MDEWIIATSSPEETRTFGRMLGEQLNWPMTVRLSGPLGAGKTCFAQGFAVGLGVPADEPITSPSYTLMNLYQGRLPLYHFDLYRLSAPDDLDDLGFDEYLAGEGVSLVEWADRFGDDGGQTDGLNIQIQVGAGDRRDIVCRASGTNATRFLGLVANAWSGNPVNC